MAETAELDVAPDTIEATVNYIVDDGNKVFTIVASPGGTHTSRGVGARSSSVPSISSRTANPSSCRDSSLAVKFAGTEPGDGMSCCDGTSAKS